MDLSLFKEMAAKAQGKSLIDTCLVEIESLRQQLVSVTKERDEIAAQARMLDRMVDERDEQLAAALAACEAKDAAIQWIQTRCAGDALPNWETGERTYHSRGLILDHTNAALAIKPDASALRQHDTQLLAKYNINHD